MKTTSAEMSVVADTYAQVKANINSFLELEMIKAYIAYFSSISFIELLRIIGVIIIFPLLLIVLAWSCSKLAEGIVNYLSND